MCLYVMNPEIHMKINIYFKTHKERYILKKEIDPLNKHFILIKITGIQWSKKQVELNDELVICISQAIKFKKCDLIFYGTGCCDMASKYKAVQSIGKKGIRDLPGPVFIESFGNLQMILDQYSQKFIPG